MQLLHIEEKISEVPPEYTIFDNTQPLELPSKSIPIAADRQPNVAKRKTIPWEHKKTRFHDSFFTILFVFAVVGFIIIASDSIKYVYKLHQQKLDSIWQNFLINTQNLNIVNALVLGVFVISAALLIGFIQLLGIILFYKAFVIGAFLSNLIVGISLAIYFIQHQMFKAFLTTLAFMIIIIILACKLHNKILFSNRIIKIGSKMMRSTPSIWIVYMCMLTLNSSVLCFYFIILYTSYITWKDDLDPNKKYYLWSFLLFFGYYLTEVFQNSTQVVVGAIVAKWYYASEVGTIDTLKNTFVKCFGSICLGSLFSSILSILKEIVIFFKPNDKILRFPLLRPLWKLIEITIFCLNYTLKYFNNYSFAYISVHSSGYIRSSIKMYKLYCNKGYSTLVSECIINVILTLYVIFSGILGGLVAYTFIQLVQPEFMSNHTLWWMLMIISALLAMQISRMIAMIINAFVYVLFVCLIQHREVMQYTHPEEYKSIHLYLSPTPPTRTFK